MIGVTVFILAAVIILIWVLIEFKRLKHKIFAMFLIGLLIFTYVSFTVLLKGKDIDLKTVPGVMEAGKLYFSWLGSLFTNTKSITSHAVKLDWKSTNSTSS